MQMTAPPRPKIKWYSREATLGGASKAAAIRCYSEMNQQQNLMLMKSNDPHSRWSETHLNNQFHLDSLRSAGMGKTEKTWIQGRGPVLRSVYHQFNYVATRLNKATTFPVTSSFQLSLTCVFSYS